MPEVSSLLSSGNVPREKEGLPLPCFEGVVLWTRKIYLKGGEEENGMVGVLSSLSPQSLIRVSESRGYLKNFKFKSPHRLGSGLTDVGWI